MNTNKNSYIIIYSAILVVVVAFLLAFVYSALKPQQDINVALDKKKQILASLNIRDLSDADAAAKYTEVVECDEIIDTNATVINKGEKGEVKIEYQTWQAISRENQTFNCGTQVVVSEIIGNKLLVQQIKEIDIN